MLDRAKWNFIYSLDFLKPSVSTHIKLSTQYLLTSFEIFFGDKSVCSTHCHWQNCFRDPQSCILSLTIRLRKSFNWTIALSKSVLGWAVITQNRSEARHAHVQSNACNTVAHVLSFSPSDAASAADAESCNFQRLPFKRSPICQPLTQTFAHPD